MRKLFLLAISLFIVTECHAATLYGKIAGGSWTAAATWSNVNAAGIDNSGPPLAGDNCILEAASGNITITAASVCRSISMTSGTGNYAAILNHDAGFTLTIGDATAGAGNVALAFVGAGTYTIDNTTTSALAFISTSATVQTIDFNGFNTGNTNFDAASNGSWQLVTGAWGTSAAAQTITLTKGTLDTNGQAVYGSVFTTAAGTKTLTLGASTITLSKASGTAWSWSTTTATLNENTSTIVCNGATATFAGGTDTYATVTFDTGAGLRTITGANTFGTLNFQGSAIKTDSLTTSSNQIVTGTLNIDGNSSINRVLVYAATLGTPITLTLTGATVSGCSNVDFRDITFTSTGAMDFSDIAGGSGDCGGNTAAGGGALTFTIADDWYWCTDAAHGGPGAGTYNMEDGTYWFTASAGGGTVMDSDPRETGNCKALLPQDNAFFDVESVSGATHIDQNEPRICKTIDFSNVDNVTWDIGNINETIYGGLTLANNVTLSIASERQTIFEGRGAFTLTSSGKTLMSTDGFYISMIGGSLTQLDNCNYTQFTSGRIQLLNGTFDANDFTVVIGLFYSNGALARKLLMGNGTWSIHGRWEMSTTTNLDPTWSAEGSTIIFTSNSPDQFRGGGLTYNNITFNASTNTNTLTGSNTFNTFTINAPKTVSFTAGTTTKIKKLIANGQASKRITITSASSAPFTLTDTDGGENTIRHCDISWCNATPAFQSAWLTPTREGNIDRSFNKGLIFNPGEVWIRLKTAVVGGAVYVPYFWHNTLND